MDKPTRSNRFSLTTVIALLALFVGLSGTAYAAATIGTSDIKNKAVTTPKLDTGAVTTAKLGPQAVKPAKIALGAVRTAKIFDAAVTTGKLADNSVTTAKIADNSVTTAKIADGNVLNQDLANNSVSSSKILDGNVTNADLGNNSVTNNKIADGHVRAAELTAINQVSNGDTIAANGTKNVSVTCPAGTRIISGGHTTNSFLVSNVASLRSGNGWVAGFRSTSGAEQTVSVAAYCLAV
jgi:hypothetical protein